MAAFLDLSIFLGALIVLFSGVRARPEFPNCDWVTGEHVERMRDVSDCRRFYHCAPGQRPLRETCPQDHVAGYILYFNPKTTTCDHWYNAPPECFGTGGGGGGGGGSQPVPPVQPTTPTTTTTTKPPRPPLLDDEFEFEVDCSKRRCGIFPNTYGPCETFALCMDGEKIIKNCNGGQLFDIKTKECQPAALAQCWTEPNAGVHNDSLRKSQDCPFHGNEATEPYEENADGSVVLQNPEVTNWGEWQEWKECPEGMYATGLYAWRRVLQSKRSGMDHIGMYALSLRCQSPGGNETEDIESHPPGGPGEKWPFYYMCTGAMIGFQLNSAPKRGRDEIATDNVKGYCSCSEPVYKPYELPMYAPQSGNRGEWTQIQFCKKNQAVCGMKTQMHAYKERAIGKYDNTGLNNLRVKCCDVEDPLVGCTPEEERLHIRDCDNSESDDGLKCDFESVVGLGFDYGGQEKLINFYSSVGYDYASVKDTKSSKIITALREKIESGTKLEYTWDDVMSPMEQDETVTMKSMFVKPFTKVELFQIIGKCGHFLVRSNRYVRIVKDASGAVQSETYFEV